MTLEDVETGMSKQGSSGSMRKGQREMTAIGPGRELLTGLHLGYCAQTLPRAQRRGSQGSEASPGLLMGRGLGCTTDEGRLGQLVLFSLEKAEVGLGGMHLLFCTSSRGLQRRWSPTVLMSAWEKGQVGNSDCCLGEILGTCWNFIYSSPL